MAGRAARARPTSSETKPVHFFKNTLRAIVPCAAILAASAASAAGAGAPDLDLTILHYSRTMTAEGVLRESRYEEKMLRRPGHVWRQRVLPAGPVHTHGHPNYAVLPQHVILERGKVRLEAVNPHERELIAIPPAEYENVGFDGSWENAFFLIDPKRIAALPLSQRPSAVAGAHWREQVRGGMFQRVLWDERRKVPLVVETGDRAGTTFARITIAARPPAARPLPWNALKGFAQKEFADFLD